MNLGNDRSNRPELSIFVSDREWEFLNGVQSISIIESTGSDPRSLSESLRSLSEFRLPLPSQSILIKEWLKELIYPKSL